MPLDGRHDRLLCAIAHRAQGVGQGRADCSLVHFPLYDGRKTSGQGQPACDPRLAPVEKTRHACQAQAVLFDQGANHSRFVHRSRGARRGVRPQQEEFLLGTGSWILDDCRHMRPPLVPPEGKTLEAVDDLKAVAISHDADRQFLQLR